MSPVPKIRTWVLVADGGKALLLEQEGPDRAPSLRVMAREAFDNPMTAEQGTDRPGRMADPGPGARSAMEETDWHQIAKTRFAAHLAERLNRAALKDRFDRLVLCAPPQVLGDLRAELSEHSRERVAVELPKDLTGQSIADIEQALVRASGWHDAPA